jgi:hypothetical protein
LHSLDLAIIRRRRLEVILVGDVSQLQTVENGGGLSLLVGALGYPRLAEPGGPSSQSSARHTKRKAESESTRHLRGLDGCLCLAERADLRIS